MPNLTPEQDIIEKAKALSPAISDYFEEQQYKRFTDEVQQEEVTDRYLLGVAIELLIGELKDIGIESDYTADDIIEDPLQLQTLFALRSKFDQASLYETLSHLSEKTLSDFRNAYESIELPEDLLLELGPWFSEVFPSDEQWLAIKSSIETWYSTSAFATHLSGILSMLRDVDLTPAPVTDDNVAVVSRFLEMMRIRQEKLLDLVLRLSKLFPEISLDILRHKISTYDHQKLDGDNLPLFATYNEHPVEPEPDYVVHHHHTVDHHVEYWVDRAKTTAPGADLGYTKEIAVLVVLSMVLDDDDPTTMRRNIAPLKLILNPSLYSFTEALTTIDYTTL